MQIVKETESENATVFSASSSSKIQEKKLIKAIKRKFHMKECQYLDFVTWFDEMDKIYNAEIKVNY